jgi:aminomethyltransferase
MTNAKKTPLYEIHRSLGARIVDFAGFEMPVVYGSIIDEHHAVRERVGLFDVSHMGELIVTGKGARQFVNELITNDCMTLRPGDLQYTAMCRQDGTVVDDLLVNVLAEDRLLLVVNASNIDKDLAHVTSFPMDGVEVTNMSDDFGLVAVQGPRARDVLASCEFFAGVSDEMGRLGYYKGLSFEHWGEEVLVSRTGYTGELGFEIFVPAGFAESLWGAVMEAGAPHGIAPIGLGARDTLRFEASYCLYGRELDDDTSPLEAGLGWVVKLKKERFCGLEALREEKANGSKRTLVGLQLEGKRIARQGYKVVKDGDEIGRVTSGTFSPTLQKSLCMASIETQAKQRDGSYGVEIRGAVAPATLTKLPFYKSRAK